MPLISELSSYYFFICSCTLPCFLFYLLIAGVDGTCSSVRPMNIEALRGSVLSPTPSVILLIISVSLSVLCTLTLMTLLRLYKGIFFLIKI